VAGIYLHIPFCKQACHYCNFHFVTSFRYKNELLEALLKEASLRKPYLADEIVDTIYFGGGTPSLLEIGDCRLQIENLRKNFEVSEDAEITLEVNPDDISDEKLQGWRECGINRLSIGIQSFFDEDLQWMNRAHNASQAARSLESVVRFFKNTSIDLIYGTPYLTNERWKQNLETAASFGIPHLSCYALTVEEKTPLHKMIRELKSLAIDPDKQSEQFLFLMDWAEKNGYEHYEISNFSKPGWRSRHNSSYWSGKNYLGLGPSAHSYNGESRQWNVANNARYIETINKGIIPAEQELLSETQKANEYIMTSIRTMEGINLEKITSVPEILERAAKYIKAGLIKEDHDHLILTNEGKLLADGIAANLFI
jgi:oxygen-independent coproporphyrinogen III oxidase